jgi:hypothetical protein
MSEPPLPDARTSALAGGIPYGRLFAAVAAAALALQMLALTIAVVRWLRARRDPAGSAPSLRLAIGAGLATLGVWIAAAGCIHAARTITMDVVDRRRALWDGIYGIDAQVGFFPVIATVMFAVALLWIAGLWFTLDARRRVRGGGDPPLVAAIVTIGPVPTIVGVWRWQAILTEAFDPTGGQAPAPHDPVVLRAADAAGARLEMFARASGWAIAALAVVALVLLVRAHRRARAQAGGPAASPGRSRASLAASAIALSVAASLFLAARPMRAENRLAWPPNHDDDRAWMDRTAPALEGPDTIERAPVVHVWAPASTRPPLSEIWLDDRVVAPSLLVDKLWTLRNELARRHPDRPFTGAVVAVISRDAAYDEVVAVLRAMHDAGFPHPQFAFTHWETTVRPKLGRLKRLRATGVRVTLVDDMDKEYAEDAQAGVRGALVRLSEFDSYDALARRLVDLRRVGQAVVLDLAALK